ncbi:MAG: spore germination protein, partial [Lachnospiraceae bacterium]|nr:spore germination protein [Lachnospiraceae bacterium]
MKIASDIHINMSRFHQLLNVNSNFDVIYHTVTIGGKQACFYMIDGFVKDQVIQRIMQGFSSIRPEDMPPTPHDFSKQYIPYSETGLESEEETILIRIFSGLTALFIDGYDRCILIDCRTYPARGVSEPDKDKVLRGSRDGFVETLIFNTALIRRRIRDKDLTVEYAQAGESSHTDIAICYMNKRVDKNLLNTIRTRIRNLQVDA